MLLLAVETSTLTGAVALLEGERLVAECRLAVGLTHGERLMATIDAVLDAARVRLDDVGALAVAVGPGSFTGLRIGVSTVKGLAFATGRPVVGVPTLDALAWTVPHCGGAVCPVLDARKGEVYTALYRTGAGRLERLGEPRAVTPRALVDELARGPGRPVVLVGDGVGVLAALGEESLAGIACIAPLAQRAPSAVTVGDLARAALARGEASDPAALVPLYVRRSEAEIARERRRHVGDCH